MRFLWRCPQMVQVGPSSRLVPGYCPKMKIIYVGVSHANEISPLTDSHFYGARARPITIDAAIMTPGVISSWIAR